MRGGRGLKCIGRREEVEQTLCEKRGNKGKRNVKKMTEELQDDRRSRGEEGRRGSVHYPVLELL